MEMDYIHIRGAREHNLDIDELRIPKKQLVVFTGVSGSGKSSLAFDTLYAEGQRRYVESLSSYARQFLGQMEKPHYDHIRGLSPTIAIEQKSASANPRSTVGTITEILDYLRVLYARVGRQHCHQCGGRVETLSTDQVVARVQGLPGKLMLAAPLVEHRKGEFRELLEDLRGRGFARVRIDGQLQRLAEPVTLDKRRKHSIELVIDRIDPAATKRSRLLDSVETALVEGQGVLLAIPLGSEGKDSPTKTSGAQPSGAQPSGAQPSEAQPLRFSQHRYCATCEVSFPELSPQAFSFNSPLGMCHACNGLGKTAAMDPDLVIPDPTLSIREGALAPLRAVMERGHGWTFNIMAALEKEFRISLDKPWNRLSAKQREVVLYGAGERSVAVQWRAERGEGSWNMRFEGILNSLARRYRETKSETMREYYRRYQSDRDCQTCGGERLRPESRAVSVSGCSIVDVTRMPVAQASAHFTSLALEGSDALIAEELLKEINARLGFLCSVGLDYLTLDRAGPTLAGGEAQRIRLASQLGSELSGVMYVLDEPSIGLHQRDNRRLIATLKRLRDAGNTVLVVEHDQETIETADHVLDFGPGAGRLGGKVVFEGSPAELRQADTLTGQYLGNRARIEVPGKRRRAKGKLCVVGAREHNLKDLTVAFPLGTFTAVTGVSGAGKSSLVTGILYPALSRRLHGSKVDVGTHSEIEGTDQIDKVIHIDQSPIGRTPRSNPATYTKLFDEIRALFAKTPEARARGYQPGRFSFNVKGGRCEACSGDGVKRVEMHFLPDVYVPCEVCQGRRYNEATLQVRYRGLTIADVLKKTVRESLEVFGAHPKLCGILQTLRDVGLDYVELGQPAPTLSGGEAQRVKLSRELAKRATGRTLYVLDEPTTGLHFEDIRKLLGVLDRLVQAGNTVVVIEHNLDVVKCADHVIDLGPEGGDGGGQLVCAGTPERVAQHKASHTGRFLAELLPAKASRRPPQSRGSRAKAPRAPRA